MSRVMSFLLLISIASMVDAQGDASAKKGKFVSEKGRFSVKFPGRVRSQVQEVETAFGKMKSNIEAFTLGQNMMLMVVYCDLPPAAKADPSTVFENIKPSAKGFDGVIVKDEGLTFGPDKLPARRLLVRKENNMMVRNLIILKDERIYQVIVMGPGGLIGEKRAEEFVSSFEITK
ncbi:MAG: hypothetical protein U0796_16935 [Gemmatales bacterium]